MIAHAWLHMFGVPKGLRVVRLERPAYEPRGGVRADRYRPGADDGQAVLEIARE
ncbi:hypothetical protein GCM10009850_114860 [Nonomuraea monospora]|uniref:Uncharacterized protein n=1 Tax=Nonomuraea monospora TaxID=568818 RepID=A0ABN3D2M6_9ACTN